jgi:lysophospholipase L1-like esterase
MYLPEPVTSFVSQLFNTSRSATTKPQPPRQNDLEEGRRLLAALLGYAKSHVLLVAVLHHFELIELKDGLSKDGTILDEDVRNAGVPLLLLNGYLADYKDIDNPYRDNIHINVTGQRLYADAIVCAVRALSALRDFRTCQTERSTTDHKPY